MIPPGLCQCGCGQPTVISPASNAIHGYTRGAPRRYVHGHNRKLDPRERFLSFTRRETNGCLLWTGGVLRDTGYGSFTFRDPASGETRTMGAHRAAYILFVGPIPKGAFICHTCDRRLCVETTHLYAGDVETNTADKVARGGTRAGESHPNATVDAAAVVAIRQRYAAGEATQEELAREHGVTQSNVSDIVHGHLWPNAGGPIVTRRMQARLSPQQVAAIRTRAGLGVIGPTRLAKMYGVSRQTIHRILADETWRRERR